MTNTIAKIVNPFRHPVMRHAFDACIAGHARRHSTFFSANGERRRSPNFGSSVATWFWRGVDDVRLPAWWQTREDRETIAYAYWRAGQAVREAYGDRADDPPTPAVDLDHYVRDWVEVLERVEGYVAALAKANPGAGQ